jgi:Carbohydrate family 9 binding domain-like
LLSLTTSARAGGRMIHAEPMAGEKIRIDGDLREWPAKMTELGEMVQGSASGGDPKAGVTLGYDDTTLYCVLRVTDKKLYRTSAAGANEDHATLFLSFPKGQTYEIGLYPGDPGKSPGLVKIHGAAVPSAKLVEAPTTKGYDIEAAIPWSVFPEAARQRVGLRAAVRLTDADAGGSVKAVIATSGATVGRALPPLLTSAEEGLNEYLTKDKGLSSNPQRDAYGNVSGDAMLERVAVFGPLLAIVGPTFRGGKEFYVGELGIEDASMVTRLELVDLDGDGHDEIVIQKRLGAKDHYREVLTITKVGRDDQPFQAFAHEVGLKTKDGFIANKVSIHGGIIEIAQGDSDGFDPSTYDEPTPSDMGGTILPWESVKSKSFKWQGDAFKPAGETSWTPKVVAAKGGPAPKTRAPEGPAQPAPPRSPTQDELLDRVYALYKKDRGTGNAKPRFDFVTDVAGDDGPERVVIHDRDLVVFGKGFRNGTSYAFITIGVPDSKDILDATARDLTGDGKAEIIVRGVLHAKASKALGAASVDRYALFVYGVEGDTLVRIFAAETGRAVEKDRVLGAVSFTPGERGATRIELRSGHAVGWTEKTYPFPEDTTTAGGLEPLLLPWGAAKSRGYRWDGKAYVAE